MGFDLMWIFWFLVAVVVLAAAYWIVKSFIMPVVPATAQPIIWAIIGLVMLAILIYAVAGFFPRHSYIGSHPR